MKSKKILVVYSNVGNGFVAKELMLQKVLKEMSDEGRVVKNTSLTPHSKTISFEDGTKISVIQFGKNMVGSSVTHLYIEDNIFQLQNGEKFVDEVLKSLLVSEGNYIGLDVKGNPKERMFRFTLDNNDFNISQL